jgi:hypothetical protein
MLVGYYTAKAAREDFLFYFHWSIKMKYLTQVATLFLSHTDIAKCTGTAQNILLMGHVLGPHYLYRIK